MLPLVMQTEIKIASNFLDMQLRLPLFDMRQFDAGQKIAQKTLALKQ
jgi:hypothetical protein